MEPGKIVLETKTKSGFEIIIRYPQLADVQLMADYINTLSKEETYISFQGEQTTIDEEKNYLDDLFKKFETRRTIYLLAFHEELLIGSTSIEMGLRKVNHHVGLFGILVAKDFRAKGIGRILMKTIFNEAEKYLPQLKLCTLEVFKDNTVAQSLYESFGFQLSGVMPMALRHKDHYDDGIWMYKKM